MAVTYLLIIILGSTVAEEAGKGKTRVRKIWFPNSKSSIFIYREGNGAENHEILKSDEVKMQYNIIYKVTHVNWTENGFAKFCEVTAECTDDGVVPRKIKFVPECPRQCQDPANGKLLDGNRYKVAEIRREQLIKTRYRGTENMHIPFLSACSCRRQGVGIIRGSRRRIRRLSMSSRYFQYAEQDLQ